MRPLMRVLLLCLHILQRAFLTVTKLLVVEDLFLGHQPCLEVAFTVEAFLHVWVFVASAVVTGSPAAVGNMKSAVHSDSDVQIDDYSLDGEIEEIVTPLGVIPSWLVAASRRLPCCSASEGSAKTQENGAGEQNENLGPPATDAKLVQPGLARNKYAQYDHGQGQERDEHQIRSSRQLYVSIDPTSVCIEGVEALHCDRDDRDEHDEHESIEDVESGRQSFVPTNIRMSSSNGPLGEDEIYEEEEEDTGAGEDLGRNSHAYISWACCPDDAHDHGRDSSHADTKHQARHDEFMSFPFIEF